jgi:ABC-type Fe3+ transport system permease subunit
MKVPHFYPLLGFAIPSLIIGYGFVIPRNCFEGFNPNSLGFGLTILGTCTAYWRELRRAIGPQTCEVKKNAKA